MNLLTTSWRQSLATAAVAALFTAGTLPAEANDGLIDGLLEETTAFDLEGDIIPVAFNEDDEESEVAQAIETHERELREAFSEMEEEMRNVHREYKHERERIEERAHEIERTMHDNYLSKEDREALDGKMKEMRVQMEGIEHGARERAEALNGRRLELEHTKLKLQHLHMERQARQLEEKAEAIKRELEDIGDSNPDQARQLQEMLKQIGEHHRGIERKHRELEKAAQEMDLVQMRRMIGHLHETGEHGKAEELEREARKRERNLSHRDREMHDPPPRDRPRGDRPQHDDGNMESRIDHLRIAVENLHAAGMHDRAEELMQETEKIMRERRYRPDIEVHHGPPPHAEHRDSPPQHDRVAELDHEVRELNAQVRELREELGDIHKYLETIVDRPKH